MTHAIEMKKIAGEVLGPVASDVLMKRILVTLDEATDPKTAASKVEKIVALFLGTDHAKALEQRFRSVVR